MTFDEYERSGIARYEGLAEVVASILRAAIVQHGNFHPQQIQHRAKSPTSLKRKLEKAGAAADGPIEPHAKDLAGARVIFYTNDHVERFQQSRLLSENFEIDWDRTKFHHPATDNPEATELFMSSNYVVRLKPERAALPEYARLADLWCEVQVQTTLNHAWAEMAHDTIYKKPELQGFGARLMEGIEARMKAIMRDYLAPAGYAFQKVASDFDRLSRGQALFERDLAAEIEAAEDNNQLHETLQKFRTSVLPHFDDHEAAAGDIVAAAVRAVERSRTLPARARQTPFGDLSPRTSADVATVAAAIMKELRFLDIEGTFDTICDLFLTATDEKERECWVKLADGLAEHNLEVWKLAGPVVQWVLMERVQALTPQKRLALKPVLLTVARRSLSAELSGTTSSFDTITLHQGAVTPSDALRTLRQQALELLFAYDEAAETEEQRAEIIKVMKVGMSMPSPRRQFDPALAAIIYGNAATIITHYIEQVPRWSYEQQQTIEHRLLWKYRHHGEPLADDPANAEAEEARTSMIAAILAFRDRVNADNGFTTYKLLVGFESVFPPAWENREFDHDEEEAYRQEAIGRLVEEIDATNADHWLAIIKRCAATESNDLATFPTFATFLEQLSAAKPELILTYFPQFNDRIASFLTPFYRGLSRTPAWDDAVAVLEDWIAQGRFLSSVAFVCGTVEKLDLRLLESAMNRALEMQDDNAVLTCIHSVALRDSEESARQLKPLFLRAVDYLIERREARWVHYWNHRQPAAMLARLTKREIVKVLGSLVAYERVGSRLEWFLADVAKTRPQEVIDYFGRRIALYFKRDYGRDYEDIPYDLHRLNEPLANAAKALVTTARSWFSKEPDLFSYHGGKLIEVVFPSFSPDLQQALSAYVGTGDPQNTRFVIEVMRAYSGEAFLQSLAKDIVATLPPDDDMLDLVEISLEPSGVTSGEFGRVNRLVAHRESILGWADDERETVSAFSARYSRQLENRIRTERQRAEESSALRRLEWDRLREPNDSESDTTYDNDEPDNGRD